MLFKNISLIDENMHLQENMYVGTKGNIISYIGSALPENSSDYGEPFDGNGKLLIPGFFNAHSHAPMYLMRGYGENLSLSDWLNTRIFPFEAKMTGSDMYTGCLLNIAEMLRFGIVGSSDMYLDIASTAKAFADSGMKGNVSLSFTCFTDDEYSSFPHLTKTLDAIAEYKDHELVTPEFSLHAEYTSTEKTVRALAEKAQKANSAIHVHVSETADEVLKCKKRHHGKSPVSYLADCGVFDVPTIAAHCVHIEDSDIEILKEKNVTIASCPKSNLKLSSGICPAYKLIEKGVNVALGTDSVASNNNVNMIEEIRFFSLLQKHLSADATAISPAEALYAATRAGAMAQRRADTGVIKEGFCADLAVLDINKIYMHPAHDILSNLIYSASGNDVYLTMVNGKVLYQNGEYFTIDTEKLKFEADKITKRILMQ